MEDIAIGIQNVSIRFNMSRDRVDSIKEYAIRAMKGQLFFDEFWALKDVSFEVKKGEVFGLVGLNGAGKSTILKVVAGVLKPTRGQVTDPDLTARENVFMNGAILGYNTAYMKERYREIMDFAELESFADVPVKNFSSGMYARLGFAIATMVKPEILIVDEILAVGDFRFQKKCQKRIAKMIEGGTTVLIVSHSNEMMKSFCDRVAWLEQGKLREIGPAKEICDKYIR